MKVAENVAGGPETPAAVLQGWMHSPPHRQNILGPFSDIGVAHATGADGRPYWCVVFGAPLPTLNPHQATATVIRLLNQQRSAARLPPLQATIIRCCVVQTQAMRNATTELGPAVKHFVCKAGGIGSQHCGSAAANAYSGFMQRMTSAHRLPGKAYGR